MGKGKTDHVRARSDLAFICEHCGAEQPMPSPVEIDVYVAASRAFLRSHRECKPPAAAAPGEVRHG